MSDTHTDRASAALAALDAEGELWDPQPGYLVAGVVVGFGKRQAQFGLKKTVHPELEGGRTLTVQLASWVLGEEVEERDPKIGDTLAIRRNEDRIGPRGVYRHYKVAVVRGEQAEQGGSAS